MTASISSVMRGSRKLSQYHDMQADFDTRLDTPTLDRIDEMVAQGYTLRRSIVATSPPWMTPEVRRTPFGFDNIQHLRQSP
jgi:hypothetical protein